MKLWEVLKALEENPKKVFEYGNVDRFYTMSIDKACGESYFQLTAVNEEGENISDLASGQFDGNLQPDNDWQEVKQSVTWQEALKAWSVGKTIRLELGEKRYSYRGSDDFLRTINGGIAVMKNEIINGTWYIEN